jgi:cell division protein FtsW
MFPALATFGVAILFSFQVFVNIGVSSGLLPTKGLTLPFISYGGSSLLICCLLMAFVMRAHWELAGHTPVVPAAKKVMRTSMLEAMA